MGACGTRALQEAVHNGCQLSNQAAHANAKQKMATMTLIRLTMLILAAVLLPVALTMAIAAYVSVDAVSSLGRTASAELVKGHTDSETDAMRRLVRMGMAQLKVAQSLTQLDLAARQEVARQMLTQLNAGQDYYIFVYSTNGVCQVQPWLPKWIGKNKLDWPGNGKPPVIKMLIEESINRKSNGLVPYRWPQPSTGSESDKLGYVEEDPVWHWVVGTGIYVDGLDVTARQIEVPVAQAHQNLVRRMFSLSLVLVPVAVLAALALRLLLAPTVAARRPSV